MVTNTYVNLVLEVTNNSESGKKELFVSGSLKEFSRNILFGNIYNYLFT
jgi:hypothetical protein